MSGATSKCWNPKSRPVRPKPVDHLVGDQEHVVAVADLAEGAEVVGRRRQAGAGGAEDRLGDEGGDRLGPLLQDDPLQVLGAGEGALVAAVRAAVRVAGADVGEVEQVGGVVAAPRRPPRHGEGAHGVAVPALPAGDDLVLAGVARLQVVLAGDLQGRLGRLGAAGDEEHAVQVAGGQGRDAVGQLDLRFGEEARVGEGDLARLRLHRLGDLGDAVADADHVDAGAGVEPGAAVVAVEPAALAAGDAQPAVLADSVEEAVAGHGQSSRPARSRVTSSADSPMERT